MCSKFRIPFIVYSAVGISLAPLSGGQPAGDPLVAGFNSPPDSAKPRTWWHWMMSNVTKAGITKDLKWMKRVGIAGFQLADVNFGRGQSVDPKTPIGTPEWFEAVRHAAAEADRLGLEMAIFSSSGWSETGVPWVKPHEAMKKFVWSETRVEGPTRFSGKLAAPPSTIGQIRNTGATYYSTTSIDAPFYADAAVVAYRTPASDANASAPVPQVTTHDGPVDGAALLDDSLGTLCTIPAPAGGGPAWVQYEYPQPFVARAITLGGRGGSANGIPVGRVLASDDGQRFRVLVTLPGAQLYRQGMVRTFAFTPTSAKFYRIELTGAPLNPAATMSNAPAQPAAQYVLSEAILHRGARDGTMAEKLKERGLGIYAEAAGVSLEMPEDTLLNKSKVEIPMGEFWVRDLHPRLMYQQDVRGAASASHVYGKPLTAAEAFTGGGYESAFTLKKVGDYWLSQGINRVVFHTSAHQPLDTKPGNTMVGTQRPPRAGPGETVRTFFAAGAI